MLSENKETLQKYLRNSGGMIELGGLVMLIFSLIAPIFLSLLGSLRYNLMLLLAIIPSFIIALIFIIFGGRIRSGVDKNSQTYLIIVAIISGIMVAVNIIQGSNIIIITGIFISTLVGLYAFNKLKKYDDFLNSLLSPAYKIKKAHLIALGIVGIIPFLLSLFLFIKVELGS